MNADLIAIDPGSSLSAWVALDGDLPVAWAKVANEILLDGFHRGFLDGGAVPWYAPHSAPIVIEWMTPRGMPTSAQELETCWWVGRFTEALLVAGWRVERLSREAVKRQLIGSYRPKGAPSADSRIHAALIDRYGGTGGKEAAVGRKATPGPLHGITGDGWAALALAVAWQDGAR